MSLRKIKNLSLNKHFVGGFINSQYQCCCQKRNLSVKLQEMGKFVNTNKENEPYTAGQMFFHKVFPYRGVILHPWLAKVLDKGQSGRTYDSTDGEYTGRKLKKRNKLYYQVLVDEDDIQHLNTWRMSVTFLPPDYTHRNSLIAQPYSIPGIDYVSHDDVMPYMVTEKAKPIQHELFNEFLTQETLPDGTFRYVPKDRLKSFQEKNHPWLYLSEVYTEVTDNIRVTVIPFYMGIQESYNKFWWRYCVRIENLGEETVKLRGRQWSVFSRSTSIEHTTGSGVVGQEPKLTKTSPAFQYNSHVSLESPTGYMWGTFDMEREDGTTFKCNIPTFNLNKVDERVTYHPSDDPSS